MAFEVADRRFLVCPRCRRQGVGTMRKDMTQVWCMHGDAQRAHHRSSTSELW